MEKYVNNKTLVESEIAKALKSSVTCPLCSNILISPVMCMGCQKVYCKKCIDNSVNIDRKCKCDNKDYQKCIGKNEILSQLNFYCVGCGQEIKYEEAQKHHDSCCPDKTSEDMNSNETPKQAKIKKIKPEEISLYKKDGEKIPRITSKIII
jgi:hypothetical protein